MKLCHTQRPCTQVRDSMVGALLSFAFLISSTCIFMSLALPLHDDKVQLA